MKTQDRKRKSPIPQDGRQRSALRLGGEIAGATLLVLSIIFMVGGWQLGLGVPTRLGTGAFPFISGAILAIFSIVIFIEERGVDDVKETPDWVGFIAIIGALAIFAATADRFGLIPSAFLTVIVASFPDRGLSLVGKAILGGIVAITSWVLFIELLNLPFKAFVGF